MGLVRLCFEEVAFFYAASTSRVCIIIFIQDGRLPPTTLLLSDAVQDLLHRARARAVRDSLVSKRRTVAPSLLALVCGTCQVVPKRTFDCVDTI